MILPALRRDVRPHQVGLGVAARIARIVVGDGEIRVLGVGVVVDVAHRGGAALRHPQELACRLVLTRSLVVDGAHDVETQP